MASNIKRVCQTCDTDMTGSDKRVCPKCLDVCMAMAESFRNGSHGEPIRPRDGDLSPKATPYYKEDLSKRKK